MPVARASIGAHLVRPRTPPQMLNARNMSGSSGAQQGQPQGGRPGSQRDEGRAGDRAQQETSSRRGSSTTNPTINTQQPSPLGRNGPQPPPPPTRPPVTPTTPSSSSFSSFFSSTGLGSKAKSSVSYLASNSKPYRSALANAGSYVASQAGLIPDRSVRGNAEGNEKEKSWGEWARDWRDRRAQEGKAEESLNLLPGWVVLRPREDKDKVLTKEGRDDDVKPFDLEISTSGFANSLRSPENASRSQRVFMKIAKSFAALPNLPAKIAEDLGGELGISSLPIPGTNKSPTPNLSEEPGQMDARETTTGIDIGTNKAEGADRTRGNGMTKNPQLKRSMTTTSTSSTSTFSSMEASFLNMTQEQLRAFHENLDARLQPFWSSALQRRVQLSIYAVKVPLDKHPRHDMQNGEEVAVEPPDPEEEPLMRNVFTTDAQGLFAQKIVIPWERIISHGPSLPMAFQDPPKFEYSTGEQEPQTATWGLFLKAELLSEGGANRLPPSATALQPPSSPSFTSGTLLDGPKPVELDADMWDPGANAFFSPNAKPWHQGSGGPGGGLMNLGATRVVASTWTPIASVGGVRVISDLDDTVKVSNILSGTREVFRNAFCRPVEETEAEGMSELYRHLATQGVAGFHYVSNSPYELLPVLQKFFKHHAFPTGFSLKLKYYGGRNLMNGLFEPPGDRKRPGIIDVMDSFPRAKFVLIGDSGEQDLELYVAIAKQRKDQVLAIAIRDVTTPFTANLSRFNTNASSASSIRSGVRTPMRQSSAVSSSDIDLAALSEALAVEGTGHDGVDQAARSGVAGRTRDAARKLAGKAGDLDLGRLRLHRSDSNSSNSSDDSPARGSSTPRKVNQDPLGRHPEDLEEAIADIGAGDDLTPPGTPAYAENMLVKQTEAEMQELSATQLKLVKRAAEWSDRRYRAQNELPPGVRLLFFQHPEEVEDEIVGIVRSAYGTTPAE